MFEESATLDPMSERATPAQACQQCGRGPAASVTFQGDNRRPGTRLSGRFCHDCGIATFRTATAWCLTRGWLSRLSVVVVPLSVVANLTARHDVARLGPPQPLSARGSSLPLGRTLWLRWQILGALIPPLLVMSSIGSVVWAINARHTAARQTVGKCLMMTEDPPSIFMKTRFVSCDSPHNGVVARLAKDNADCPPDMFFVNWSGNLFCIAPH